MGIWWERRGPLWLVGIGRRYDAKSVGHDRERMTGAPLRQVGVVRCDGGGGTAREPVPVDELKVLSACRRPVREFAQSSCAALKLVAVQGQC